MKRLDVPIGESDFKSVREYGKYYVDKTSFIREILESAPTVLLFPRPRRFGKSLNLSMLRYFFERTHEDRRPLFEGLAVMRDDAAVCRPHFQRYPVIYVRFKDIWAPDKAGAEGILREEVRRMYAGHMYLLTEKALRRDEEVRFWKILDGQADGPMLNSAILELSGILYRFHRERVIVLIDEYDAPLHSSYLHGSFAATVAEIRQLLSTGLKDNPYMFKAILTGVLRVSQESIFSGLNNLEVYSILSSEFATSFGFTEEEVKQILQDAEVPELLDQVRAWYQGYLFGNLSIYNPWSLLSFIRQKEPRFRRYWSMTNEDEIPVDLTARWASLHHDDFKRLLRGKAIKKPIEENIALGHLKEQPEAIWSIMAMAGYLRVEPTAKEEDGWTLCKVSFPNREVKGMYPRLFRRWMEIGLGGKPGFTELWYSLLEGNEDRLMALMDGFLLKLSSYDRAPREPEAHYHIFVMGLLVQMEGEGNFEVRSNRESGFGRYDVMILPKRAGQPGVVIEFKVFDSPGSEVPDQEKIDAALEKALLQIEERDYVYELRERGASPIQQIAILFHTRRTWVRARSADPKKKTRPRR